jgi:hypothetical protein
VGHYKSNPLTLEAVFPANHAFVSRLSGLEESLFLARFNRSDVIAWTGTSSESFTPWPPPAV